jgi:hypothetical protein
MARNPGGHEPQLDYPLDKEDAPDLLTLISFLYREIDKTSYIETQCVRVKATMNLLSTCSLATSNRGNVAVSCPTRAPRLSTQ